MEALAALSHSVPNDANFNDIGPNSDNGPDTWMPPQPVRASARQRKRSRSAQGEAAAEKARKRGAAVTTGRATDLHNAMPNGHIGASGVCAAAAKSACPSGATRIVATHANEGRANVGTAQGPTQADGAAQAVAPVSPGIYRMRNGRKMAMHAGTQYSGVSYKSACAPHLSNFTCLGPLCTSLWSRLQHLCDGIIQRTLSTRQFVWRVGCKCAT